MFPSSGNGGYDALRYEAVLEVDPATAELSSTVVMEATSLQQLTSYSLDFSGSLAPEVTTSAGTASACRLDDKLVVVPEAPIEIGETFLTTIRTEGIPAHPPALPSMMGWVQTAPNTIVAVGLLDATPSWFPLNRTPLDKAAFTISATVPDGFTVIGAGSLVSESSLEGMTTFIWATDDPVTDAGAQVVIGEFDKVELPGINNVSSAVFIHRGSQDDERGFEIVPDMVRFFETRFGPYPFDRADVVVAPFPSLDGATFPGTLVWQPGFPASATRLAHLLAYQWFQFAVTPPEDLELSVERNWSYEEGSRFNNVPRRVGFERRPIG